MNVYLSDYEYEVKKIKNQDGVVFANKAGAICLSGSTGSFFALKCTYFNCRDPPLSI